MSNFGIGEADIFFAEDKEGNLYFCDTCHEQNIDCYPIYGSPLPQYFNFADLEICKKSIQISNKTSNLKLFFNDAGNILLGTYDFYKALITSCCYYLNGDYYILNPKEKLHYAPPHITIDLRLY